MKFFEPLPQSLKARQRICIRSSVLFYVNVFYRWRFDIKIWLDDCRAARLCFGNSTNVKLAENLEKSVIFDSLPGVFSPGRELAQKL